MNLNHHNQLEIELDNDDYKRTPPPKKKTLKTNKPKTHTHKIRSSYLIS